jgi:hypothetical protein
VTGVTHWLGRVGFSLLETGALLWIGLILWLAFSTGGWRRLMGWSIPGQYAELGHLIRLAGRGGWSRILSRIASLAIAAGVAALILAGLLTLIRLFT